MKEVGGGPAGVVDGLEAAKGFEEVVCFASRASGVEGGLEEPGTVNIETAQHASLPVIIVSWSGMRLS